MQNICTYFDKGLQKFKNLKKESQKFEAQQTIGVRNRTCVSNEISLKRQDEVQDRLTWSATSYYFHFIVLENIPKLKKKHVYNCCYYKRKKKFQNSIRITFSFHIPKTLFLDFFCYIFLFSYRILQQFKNLKKENQKVEVQQKSLLEKHHYQICFVISISNVFLRREYKVANFFKFSSESLKLLCKLQKYLRCLNNNFNVLIQTRKIPDNFKIRLFFFFFVR